MRKRSTVFAWSGPGRSGTPVCRRRGIESMSRAGSCEHGSSSGGRHHRAPDRFVTTPLQAHSGRSDAAVARLDEARKLARALIVYCGLFAASPQEDHKVPTSSSSTTSHSSSSAPCFVSSQRRPIREGWFRVNNLIQKKRRSEPNLSSPVRTESVRGGPTGTRAAA